MAHPEAVVFIVDPDASTRHAAVATLRREGVACESFATAAEFLSRVPVDAPSCLVTALDLADMSGVDLLRRVRADHAWMSGILLAGRHEIAAAVRAMKAGALEVLTTPLSEDALTRAVGIALSRSRVTLDRRARQQALRERYESLSVRERQVMAHVVAGHLNKRIAATLGISEVTVKAHRGKVMRKMGARSLPQLVNMADALRDSLDPDARPVIGSWHAARQELAALAPHSSPWWTHAAMR